MTYSTPAYPAVQEQTGRKRKICKTDVSTVNERSSGKGEVAERWSFDLNEEEVFNETVTATTTPLRKAVAVAMAVLLEAMMSVSSACNVYIKEAVQTHEDATGDTPGKV